MPQPAIPDEVKAKVIADLTMGIKPQVIKESYGVSLPTISRIKQTIAPDVKDKMDLQRQETLADLVLTHLEVSLESSINIARMTNDVEWMHTQTASDLNKMYGTMTDKAIRMAETIEFTQKAINEENAIIEEEDKILDTEEYPL